MSPFHAATLRVTSSMNRGGKFGQDKAGGEQRRPGGVVQGRGAGPTGPDLAV